MLTMTDVDTIYAERNALDRIKAMRRTKALGGLGLKELHAMAQLTKDQFIQRFALVLTQETVQCSHCNGTGYVAKEKA